MDMQDMVRLSSNGLTFISSLYHLSGPLFISLEICTKLFEFRIAEGFTPKNDPITEIAYPAAKR